MKYQVIKNNEVLYESYDREDCEDFVEFEKVSGSHILEFVPCRSCQDQEGFLRFDFYGIATGHYCDECYESDYPYRKDRYPTMEHDGEGEYLYDDY